MSYQVSRLFILLLSLMVSIPVFSRERKTLYDFGWRDARTGSERAAVLYKAQSYAVDNNAYIDYSGIKVIDIEITKEFKSIPLGVYNDFCGTVINVTNHWKDVALFEMKNLSTHITVKRHHLDGQIFTDYPELSRKEILLVIEDENPWVDKRVGHSQGHIRKDALLIKKGRSRNTVISSYNNGESAPRCVYYKNVSETKYIRNFTLNRTSESSRITYCVFVQGQAHLRFENIVVNTPPSALYYDMVFRIYDAADVEFRNVQINGTYSQADKYGYGFYLNNIWKTTFVNVTGYGVWGVTGNNNLSDTFLKDCAINRFDIHCYGRNVSLMDCVLGGGDRGWYCGGSSIFGTIRYERCHFISQGMGQVKQDFGFYNDAKY